MPLSAFLNTPQDDWWDERSTHQQEAIEKGIEDSENGRVVSHALVREKVNGLLRKVED